MGRGNLHLLLTVLIMVLGMLGCQKQPTEVEHYSPQPILTAFLICGEPVKEVFLERVYPLGQYYEPQRAGIKGARIVITGMGDHIRLVDDPEYPGRYIPSPGENLIPLPRGVYNIEAITPRGERLTAQTIIPDTISHATLSLLYPDSTRVPVSEGDTLDRLLPPLFWEWNPVDSAGGYLLLIQALTHRDSLIPLDPSFDPQKDSLPEELKDRAVWWIMRDDQVQLVIPWIFFQFQGAHRVTLMAVSRDYYLYSLTSMQAQFGYLRYPHSNIRGGLGIFGGVSYRSVHIYVKRSEAPPG
ncbi:MAG: DUF4249 family protein [bacterium]